jgi:ferredoxin
MTEQPAGRPLLTVRVDQGTCIGSAMCVGTAPGRFELGPDRRSHPVADPVGYDGAILDAAASCPVEAITVLDAATGEPVPLE